MLIRLIQAGIVVLWLATTTWLVRDVWFPPESGFARVDADEVIGAFFEWNDSTNLVLLESGRRFGVMTINGYSGEDPEAGQIVEGLSMVGILDPEERENPTELSRASWNGTLEFGRPRELKEGQLSVRLPARGLNAHLRIHGDPLVASARLKIGEVTLFETETPVDPGDGGAVAPELPSLPENLPFGLSDSVRGMTEDILDWKPEITARRGIAEMAGRNIPVFLLILTFQESQEVKVWLSELGEPLRLETSWGHEAITEVLAPIGEPVHGRMKRQSK